MTQHALDPVVRAVSAASHVSRQAAAEVESLADLMKDDRSPVTIADLGAPRDVQPSEGEVWPRRRAHE